MVRPVDSVVGIAAQLPGCPARGAGHVEAWAGEGQAEGLGAVAEGAAEDGHGISSAESPVSVMGITGTRGNMVDEDGLRRLHELNRKLDNRVRQAILFGVDRRQVQSHDPRDYCGKWMRWYGAWDLVDELVAAGVNAWQPALWS